MSIIRRRQDGKVYLYLQLTGKQFYLGIEDKIDPNRVYEALSYLWDRITTRYERDREYYEKVGQMLENLLPEEERRRLQEATPIIETNEALTLETFLPLAEALGFRIFEKEELRKAKFTKEDLRKLKVAMEILEKKIKGE